MKWSFGVCLGTTDYLNSLVNSIVNQQDLHVSNFEIILVGKKTDEALSILTSYANSGVRIVLCDFDESFRPSWITRKKNIITQVASFDNICYMHDYVGLCRNWYAGYCNFGDDWDVSMCSIRDINGFRFRDWILATSPSGDPRFISYNTSDMTKHMYISGTYWCAKKNFMLSNPLDERRCWGQGEDIEWSFRSRNTWNYRMNKSSHVRFLKEKRWNGMIDGGVTGSEDPDYVETCNWNFELQP